ncbi:MAG: phenylphosphate carboxylase subunit delta, partial [Proteobacteria bacterium]|nr:phenylphosphate carboxylase subunit delta [Pseudomonadota bacterium]
MDLARCLPIRLLILDVDGVLTDGRIVMDDHGLESKFFHVRDGFGIKLMQRVGLKAALITGRQSRIVEVRAKDLGIEIVHQGIEDKYRCYEDLIAQLGLAHEQTAFAGDDLLDLPVMR